MSWKQSRKGFTLIELLVVITIIAVLISTMLPALSQSRVVTQRVVCQSNLRGNLQAIVVYSQDYKHNLPDDGGTTEFYSNDISGPGGVIHTKPSGLGNLYYGEQLPNMSTMFCPSESPSTFYLLTKARMITQGVYANHAKYKQQMDAGSMDSFTSYSTRFKRWADNNNRPALVENNLNAKDRYIYSFDKGPLSKYARVTLVSDTFNQNLSWVPGKNYTSQYHVNGVNTGYSDGSSVFIFDKGGKLAALPVSWPSGISTMRPITEHVFNALDGWIGYTPYTYVSGLNQ